MVKHALNNSITKEVSDLNEYINSKINTFISSIHNLDRFEFLVTYLKIYNKFEYNELQKQYRTYCKIQNLEYNNYDNIVLFYKNGGLKKELDNSKIISDRTITFIENYYSRYNKLPVLNPKDI